MTEAERYLKAAKLLRRDGWCQRVTNNMRGERCLVGALFDAFPEWHGKLVIPALDELIGPTTATFNDAPDMTAEDAVAVLEIAADLAS